MFVPQVFEVCISTHYLLRQQHAVDHMDDTVVADNVRGHDRCSIDKDFTIREFNLDQLPIDCRRRGHLHHICRKMLSRDDVIGQDSGERAFRFRLHESFDRARWEFRECGV